MLNGRSGSLDASAWLPARTHVPWSRATRSNGAVVGPGIARARRAEAGLRAAVLDVLGEHHEVGADRRLGRERRGPRDVVVDVVPRLELDEGDAQHRHGPMVRAGPAAGTV